MSIKYSNDDLNELYSNFYTIVNNIIYELHNNKINKFLFYCDYILLNNNSNISRINLPLTICLGGGGYILYNYIFKNEKIINTIELSSRDYDLSFSLKNISKENMDIFIKEIKEIYYKSINKFTYKNITKNNFDITLNQTIHRLHFRINFKPYNNDKTSFHILEMSFWLNGKVSDNFTINDFYRTKLFLYKYNEVYFYLLPLELLVKTMLYAIIDYFEKRNFNKCNKYIERIKFIKDTNDIFIKKYNSNYNNCINRILSSYKNLIKRKYKMINDYPFILSNKFATIKNNGIIKCIYRNFRINNHKELHNLIDKFTNDCKEEKEYDYKDSDITINNTDNEYDSDI
jgi:hypothetical protein